VYFALFTVYMGGGVWLKTSYMVENVGRGRGLAENVRIYRHVGREGV